MASSSGSSVPPSAFSQDCQESSQDPDPSSSNEDAEPVSEDTPESHHQVRSILDVLKSPPVSTLARKRTIRSNPPPVSAKKSKNVALKSDPKSVSPSDRVKEFPEECLMVNFGKKKKKKLFCEACREVLSWKKSSIQTHIKTTKHEERLKNS